MTKHIYDLVKSKEDMRAVQFKAEFFNKSKLLPKVVDLIPLQSAVKDQGELGYCFAFAGCSLREYIENKNKDKYIALSQLYLGYKTKLKEGTVGEDDGVSTLADVLWAIQTYGICPEDMDPYIPSAFAHSTNAFEDKAAAKYKITQYSQITSLLGLKTALAEGNVVTLGIAVYDSFESDQVAETGNVHMPTPEEQCLGGHAVLAVGYNDNLGIVQVKNSWGPNWGQKGYFTLPYQYIENPELTFDMWTAGK